MKATEALAQLKAMGTAQNRKVYSRHGVTGAAFGVSYANLGKLQRRIKIDHGLALELWQSGNHDARVLATMVADPAKSTVAQLGRWVKDVDNHVLSSALGGLVARSSAARSCIDKWTRSADEWLGSTGWNAVANVAKDGGKIGDDQFAELLERIESKIHGAENRARYSMNVALISIGVRSASLKAKALAAAKRIGPVEVDHGDTGCKTQDAVPYIQKAYAHRQRQDRKKKTARAK